MSKKNVMQRVMSLLLVTVMVFSLAACQGKANTDNTTTVTPGITAGSNEKEPAGNENNENNVTPEYDFGGRVFRIGSYYDMTPDPESNAVNAALSERIAFVEKNYNCTIEFIDLGEDYVDDYTKSVLSGNPICDIGYAITTTVLPTLIEGGIAYPISDAGVIDFNSYKWRSDVVEAGYYKGKNYTMLLSDPEIRYGIFWNKSLFNEYGLPNLYELYANGEWNWDTFRDIAQKANVDKDSDGITDIYGFNARENLAWCYLYSNEAYIAEKTETGMTVDLSDKRITEALTAFQNFTSTVNYRAIDWSVDDWDSLILSFQNGTSMMCLEELWISYMYLDKMSDDWGWVPFPIGTSANEYSCYGKENGCRIILNGVDKPEEVALVYDLITDIADNEEDFNDLLADQLETWCDDAETLENVSFVYQNGLSRINWINGFATLNTAVNTMMDAISNGSMTPQTALDTYQTQIATAVSDINTGEVTKIDIAFEGNLLTNPSFELDVDGWDITKSDTVAGISRNDGDGYPKSGQFSYHYWDDKAFTIDLRQTVTVGAAGTYVLSAFSQGDDTTGSNFTATVYSADGTVLNSLEWANGGWAAWQNPALEVTLEEGQTVTVSIVINGNAGFWGTIDDVTFVLK